MLQRLVSMVASIIGLVGRRPASILIRRRLWGWDLGIAWHEDETDEPVGFRASGVVEEEEEEED
jgi:hypothetical protein